MSDRLRGATCALVQGWSRTGGAEAQTTVGGCVDDGPTDSSHGSRASAVLYLGPALLLVASTAYGILEVHGATDTWIGLAAGRQILTADKFPIADTFSYTFNGAVWYNQNWLTHVFQYWLYSRISPNALVYGTWALSSSIFVLTLLAAYWRSGTWLGAMLAASVVALGCRDFLPARPATTGFVCLAGLWALLCALEGQRDKRRRWPIVLLLPLLLVWGNAHGSFVFGYGVLGLYVGHWVCVRVARRRTAASDRQMLAIAVVVAAALILTIVFGPFGIHNFTHGQKVAGSQVFRQVHEWYPPYVSGWAFPPVWRFWTILGTSLGVLLICWLLPLFARGTPRPDSPSGRLHTGLFDAAVVVIGLAMTLWARRFAPIYFIFGAPVFLTWIVLLLRPMGATLRRYLRLSVMTGAGLFALAVAAEAATKAYEELVRSYQNRPEFNLLERLTCYDLTPHDAIMFLKENELNVNLLAEWSQAGLVMLHAPNAKVFMDGRVQQVYSEAHYQQYHLLLVAPDTPAHVMLSILDRHNTDAALLRHWERTENLLSALEQSPDWVPALLGADYSLYLRRNGGGLAQLGGLLRRGEEWRPDSPWAVASRGFVWRAMTPPNLHRALECWRNAVERHARLGGVCFRPITAALLELGRTQEAREYVEGYRQGLSQPFSNVPSQARQELLEVLAICRQDIEAATSPNQGDD